MMDERELESAINAASRRLMAREPSRALGPNVMARVRAAGAPEPWRFKWVALSATTVLCAAIAYAVMDRTLTSVVPRLPRAEHLPIARIAIAPVASADALR